MLQARDKYTRTSDIQITCMTHQLLCHKDLHTYVQNCLVLRANDIDLVP